MAAPALPFPALVERFRGDLAALAPGALPLGIAVSGGPDSLALLLLAHAAFPGEVRAATVDHGLRSESAAEAADVARICATLGVPHAVLPVRVEPRGEGRQGEARRARYAALAAWAEGASLAALLTAHHRNDQAETLVMRLLRGSGLSGLAAIRARAGLPGSAIPLLRPLLGWTRAELAQIVRDSGLTPADDPSNRDEAHDRPRIRRLLAETPWLDAAALARSAAALAEAEEALAWAASTQTAARIRREGAALLLDPAGLPPELRRRLVRSCLLTLAPVAEPRGEQLGALLAALDRGEATTLAGVKCVGGAVWRFEPAPPRRA